MASIINASTSGAGGVITTADASGELQLQTASTTRQTIDINGNVGIGVAPSVWASSRKAIEINVKGTGIVGINTGNLQTVSNLYTDTSGTNKYANTGFAVVTALSQAAGTFSVFSTSTSGSAGGNATLNNVLQTDSNGFMYFNSGYGSAAVAYGCRAWVNFNGTGTVAIRASGNVSSITDNGTGLFRVNFTTAMPDANYSTNVTNGASQSSGSGPFGGYVNTDVAQTTALVAITTSNFNTQFDGSVVNVAVFR